MTETVEVPLLGYSIVADWYQGQTIDKILLVLPGYTSARSRQQDSVEAFVEQTGASALVIDYSGHGDSPFELKDTRPAQHFLEVICTFDWLKEHYLNAQISVIGSSYGGFLATELTKYRTFNNLVLRAPAIYKPSSFYDLWSDRLANEEEYRRDIQVFRQDTQALRSHPLLGRAAKFTGRVLVVAHSDDNLVPTQTTDAYRNAFGADSYLAKGFAHSLSQSQVTNEQVQEYYQSIANWLNQA